MSKLLPQLLQYLALAETTEPQVLQNFTINSKLIVKLFKLIELLALSKFIKMIFHNIGSVKDQYPIIKFIY
jgi:hypothetical protein